jgi:hypothetical protein
MSELAMIQGSYICHYDPSSLSSICFYHYPNPNISRPLSKIISLSPLNLAIHHLLILPTLPY